MKKSSLMGVFSCVVILLAAATFLAYGQDESTEEWVARYNGPENGNDIARAIAVDSEGNVYVTGESGIGTELDYATIKYDKNGNQVWIDYYNGPKDASDEAYDIALDSAGNVYVTGQSDYGTATGTRCDYCTIKYDTNGNRLWVARYHNTESIGDYIPNDFGRAVAVHEDTSGKVFVYVTGHSWGVTQIGGSATRDYATVKYDGETGTELWHARYDAGPDDGTYPHSIAVDKDGNVYVTGWSLGVGTDYDAATVKYDKDGNELWVARYDGPASGYDEGCSIAVDKDGNVYVTGWSVGTGIGYDFATIKYNGATGGQLWIARYDKGIYDGGERIAVDSAGNVYLTGPCWDIHYDYAAIKYDTNGSEVWVDRYNGPGNSHDYPTALAVDSCAYVYVTGRSYGTGTGWDYATIMYDSAGNRVWVARYDAGPQDRAFDIAVDSCGNVYVTGDSYKSETDLDYATIKYSQFVCVQIDIKPGSYPNTINLGSQGNVPVAIFSTAVFDATTVDPTTVTLAGALVKFKGKGTPMASFDDVNGDGITDIVVHVDTSALQLSGTDTEAILEGQTFEGKKIRGVDTVRIVKE